MLDLIVKAEEIVKPIFEEISKTVQINQKKVLDAFHECNISNRHFVSTNGYGYDDEGRDAIDRLFAKIFGCEDALVRYNFVNGTHAISTALWGILRSSDTLVYFNEPYDTLKQVISSLEDIGVNYIEANFDNLQKIVKNNKPKLVCIQRSRGYNFYRNALTCEKIGEIISEIKRVSPETIVMVDNCYGEFVETFEPTNVGADLMVSSLIKNAGGGIAQTGGYIAGHADLIEKCAERLTAVGIGRHVGCTLGANREILQGIFMAPHVVGEALKTAILASKVFELDGYEISPKAEDFRGDIVQAIRLGSAKKLLAFCMGIQNSSPIDSNVTPLPWAMPGYEDDVVMAAGTFVQGASIELTADSAMREPYVAYMQGSLTYESGRLAVEEALNRINE